MHAFQHRPDEHHLFLFLGGDFPRGDVATVGIQQHAEKIVEQAVPDLLLNLADSRGRALDVVAQLQGGVNALTRPLHGVDKGHAAGQQIHVFLVAGHDNGRVHFLVQGLEHGGGHGLQQHAVGQGVHAGAATVYVAAGHVPAHAEAGKLVIAALGKEARVFSRPAARLPAAVPVQVINRGERFVLAVNLAVLAVVAREDSMHHVKALVPVARRIPHIAQGFGQLRKAKLAHQLAQGHVHDPKYRIHPAVLVHVQAVFADG